MAWIVGIVIAVAVLVVIANLRARSIVKRHSATLSRATGMPAEQIRREMINGNVTPGEWAEMHGLDRWTLQPATGSPIEDFDPYVHLPKGIGADGLPDQSAVHRLRAMGETPLDSWMTCPVCLNDLVQPVSRVKACRVCYRAFTEGGTAPIAEDVGGQVAITGTEPYVPMILARSARANHPKLVWMLRPPAYPSTFPPMLPDDEFEERAFGL